MTEQTTGTKSVATLSVVYSRIRKENRLCPQNILLRLGPYELYYRYIKEVTGEEVSPEVPFRSPFRKDKNPSMVLFYSNEGNLLWKDRARNHSGDVFSFLMRLLNMEFVPLLEKINRDHGLRLNTDCPSVPKEKFIAPAPAKKETKITIVPRQLDFQDYRYWIQFGIEPKVLRRFKAHPCKEVSIVKKYPNGSTGSYTLSHCRDNPIYAYELGEGKYQLYRPAVTRDKQRWLCNTSSADVMGFSQLPVADKGSMLIITKSMKDVMTLYSLGIHSVSPMSESVAIPEPIIIDLKERFLRLVTLFDPDPAGIEAGQRYLRLYKIPAADIHKFVPKTVKPKFKDVSDLAKIWKTTEVRNHVLRVTSPIATSLPRGTEDRLCPTRNVQCSDLQCMTYCKDLKGYYPSKT